MAIIPLWASYLVRGYAWKTILGSDGVLNGLLQYLHITHAPLEFLLYSPFAVILTLTHIYTPFVFLPIYASLEHVPRNLVEASQDLGCSPWQTFRRVILPLSLPGVIAGATFGLRALTRRFPCTPARRRLERNHDFECGREFVRSRIQLAAWRSNFSLYAGRRGADLLAPSALKKG